MTDMTIRRALEQRRGQVERDRAVAGGKMIVEGVIDLLGTGEATVDISFPVVFTEMPIVLGGGAVATNQAIVDGEFPTFQVSVLRWDEIVNPAAPDSPTYRGCTLLIVVTGARDDEDTFQSHAFFSARGTALHNPIVAGI